MIAARMFWVAPVVGDRLVQEYAEHRRITRKGSRTVRVPVYRAQYINRGYTGAQLRFMRARLRNFKGESQR